jgi:hypothetical protein
MSDDPLFAIFVNRVTAEQREQIHEIIKEHANYGWWHGFADLWIVVGKTATAWRDLVGEVTVYPPSGVLVVKVSSDEKGVWASRSTLSESNREWIKRYL